MATVRVDFYGDESGIQGGAPYCVVSGFIASASQWDSLKEEWEGLLHSFHAPPFHAHDFFSRHEGEDVETRRYHGWSEKKGALFFDRLLEIIDGHTLFPIGGAVETRAFRSFTGEQRRFLTGGILRRYADGREKWLTSGAPTKPYFTGLDFVVHEALQNTPPDTELHFVLDRQDEYEGRAKNAFDDYFKWSYKNDPLRLVQRLGQIVYASKEKEPRLQAADLHVNLWYRVLTGGDMGPERSMAWDVLTRKRPETEMMMLDRSRLEIVLREAGLL